MLCFLQAGDVSAALESDALGDDVYPITAGAAGLKVPAAYKDLRNFRERFLAFWDELIAAASADVLFGPEHEFVETVLDYLIPITR